MRCFLNIALFSVLFLSSACSSNDDPTGGDNSPKRLIQLTIKEYPYEFGEVSSMGELYEQYKYNDKGLLVHKTLSHKSSNEAIGRFLDEFDYKYDDKGRLIQKDEYDFLQLQCRYKYTYNNIDSVETVLQYNGDGDLNTKLTFTYNQDKKVSTVKEEKKWLGDYGYLHKYEYSGNNIKITSYRIDKEELFGIKNYEYDSHNNLLKETWTSGETGKTSISSQNSYIYDSNGRITKHTHSDTFPNNKEIKEYFYNDDNTINKVVLSYSYKQYKSDLVYEYEYK